MPKKKLLKMILFNQFSYFLVGLLVLVVISIPLAKKISKQYKINQEIKDLELEISNLENKNLKLNNLVKYLESDQFVEEQARLKLNYKKDGEKMIVIKNNDNLTSESDSSADANIYNLSRVKESVNIKKIYNPQRWWYYFFFN